MAWLSENGIEYKEENILTTPPPREVLVRTAARLTGGAADLVNNKVPEYAAHYEGNSLTDDQILDLLVKVPNLLKKPVFTNGHVAVLGFKPDEMAALVRETV